MGSWLRTWYGAAYEAKVDAEMQTHVEHLRSSPADRFDVEFVRMMIPHHQTAVDRSAECADKATHPELKAMCEEMRSSQKAEIAKMKDWLKSWGG